MTLAIKWGSSDTPEKPGGLIYMDAVSSYSRDYKGKVTKHPVAAGRNISDHFIKENDTYGISGVITGTDISTFTMLIKDLEDNIPYNVYDNSVAVSISSTESDLFKLLPDVVGQFFQPALPEVEMSADRTIVTDQVEKALIDLMSGVVYNESTNHFDSNIQLVQLYEYQGTFITRITSNLVITSIKFKEDAKSGDGLYFDMTLEQVNFVTLKKGKLPKDVVNKLKGKATEKQKKGPQDSSSQPVPVENNRDVSPLRSTPLPGFGLGAQLPQ